MKALSLRNRVVVAAVGATVAGCIALVGVGSYINRLELEEALLARAEAIAKRLDLYASEGSAFQTQESVDRLLDSRSIAAAAVFSPGREVLALAPATLTVDATLATWPENEAEFRRVRVNDKQAQAVSVALVTGGRAWVVFDRAPYAATQKRLQMAWLAAGSGAVLLALIFALIAAGSVSKGLAEIRTVLVRFGEGDLEARCSVIGPGEVRDIAREVNRTASRLDGMVNELGNERSALEQQVTGRTRELEQANRLLMDIANRDALTGLANRRRLEMELERNISFSKRTGQPLAVIMMDLDRFKICNDTAGHLVGDNILRAVASTLRSRVRVTDLVVRWGGDEFCILVPATQSQGAIAAAESLVDAVKEATSAIALPEPLEPPTASAGVACFPEDGEDPNTLIRNADAALYKVKATGRGRVLRYSVEFSKD